MDGKEDQSLNTSAQESADRKLAAPKEPATDAKASDDAAKAAAEADAFDDAVLDQLAGEDKPAKKPEKKPEGKKPDDKSKDDKDQGKKPDDEEFDVNGGPAVFRGKSKRERITLARRALLRDATFSEDEIDALEEPALLEKGAKAAKRQADVDKRFAQNRGEKPRQDKPERDSEPDEDSIDDPDHEDSLDDEFDDDEEDADNAPDGRSDRDDEDDAKPQTGWKEGVSKFLKQADLQLTSQDRRDILKGLKRPIEDAIKAATTKVSAEVRKAQEANQSLTTTAGQLARTLISTRMQMALEKLVAEWPALKDKETARSVVKVMAEDDPGSRKALGDLNGYIDFARRACWAVLGKAHSQQERQRLLKENAETGAGQLDVDSKPTKQGKLTNEEFDDAVLDAIEDNSHNPALAAERLAKLSRRS